MAKLSEEKYRELKRKAKPIAVRLIADYKAHRGNWITREVVDDYRRKFEELTDYDGQNTGGFRILCNELLEKYGLIETEAINLLQGRYTTLILNKYDHLLNKIPNQEELDEVEGHIEIIRECFALVTQKDIDNLWYVRENWMWLH